jgi:lipoprotein signal peptidase
MNEFNVADYMIVYAAVIFFRILFCETFSENTVV